MNTQRLYLRNRTKTLITQILSQPQEQQMLFFGFQTHQQLEEKLERIERAFKNEAINYKIFDLIEKETQTVVGSCGFHHWIMDHNRSEIGYEIHPPYQGRGYMSEAIKKVIQHGFEVMKLNRIEALIGPDNIKSIRIIEKNNFKKEGILRGHYKTDNGFEDSIIYSLLRSDK